MRVLVVTNQYPIRNHPSYGIFVAEQVRSLRDTGLCVDVLFFNPRKTRLNYVLSLPRVIDAIRTIRYDIVHTHHTYSMILVDVARVLARTGVPVVLTNHEPELTDIEGRTQTWHPSSQLRHLLAVKRFAARRADFVIFVSGQLSAAISKNGPHDVIPCGVDLDKFRPLDRGSCRRQLGLAEDAQVIFFPGIPGEQRKRFALAKAVYEIVQKRRRNCLLLTGGGIPYDLMPIYFNAADVVLQTSFCEASPQVVKEALACGIPLVSTDAGDTRELVEGVDFCFVCSDDPLELAEHVQECLGHRVERGRERLLASGLSLHQVAQRIIRVYEQALQSSGSPS